MAKNQEEKIQQEIERRILDAEHQKQQKAEADAYAAALDDVTALSREEVDSIARSVRQEYAQKQSAFKKIALGAVIAGIVVLAVVIGTVMSQYNTIVGLEEQVRTKWG